jgi:hypothetical protein
MGVSSLLCAPGDISILRRHAIEAHIDGSHWVLPRLAADNRTSDPILDFVLIDGCHGWPTSFVDLEYTNYMRRQGGYLMIDDVNLYAEKELARLLSDHPKHRRRRRRPVERSKSSSCFFQLWIWFGCTPKCTANSATVRSPLIAATATFALNARCASSVSASCPAPALSALSRGRAPP